MGRPYVVVLTGGIASGKTAVSDRFAQLGVPVIDTDIIAREVVQPAQPALFQITEVFGQKVLTEEGHLDRRKMRQIVFSDPDSRKQLERILHPAIRARALEQVQSLDSPYGILVVPLLAESGSFQWTDRVLVVDVDPAIQIDRVMKRDGIDSEQARAILKAQTTRQHRLGLADDVIENDGNLLDLDLKVLKLHAKYTSLAQARSHQ